MVFVEIVFYIFPIYSNGNEGRKAMRDLKIYTHYRQIQYHSTSTTSKDKGKGASDRRQKT